VTREIDALGIEALATKMIGLRLPSPAKKPLLGLYLLGELLIMALLITFYALWYHFTVNIGRIVDEHRKNEQLQEQLLRTVVRNWTAEESTQEVNAGYDMIRLTSGVSITVNSRKLESSSYRAAAWGNSVGYGGVVL
jgi:hypothetical protein